jgi:hypothetical protein
VIFEKDCTPEQENVWLTFLYNQVGLPYDHLGIWDFITGSAADRNWREETAWFCDELALASGERAGLPQLFIPTFQVTPNSASIALSAWGFSARDVLGV